MITTFYFDEEMFQDPVFINQPCVNEDILSLWDKYGCLAYCDTDFSLVEKSLSKIQPKYSTRWKVAIQHFFKTKVNLSKRKISDFGSCSLLENDFKVSGIKTGVVANEYLELFSEIVGGVEVVCPYTLRYSTNFRESERLSSLDINQSEKIYEIWDSRFNGVFLFSKKIVIIDRYLMLNVIYDYKSGLRTSLEIFFELLSKNNVSYKVDIYSACDINGETSSSEVKAYLDNVLRPKMSVLKSKIEFEVNYCKNKFFSDHSHGRMIALDRHVIQIDNGLDIFREKPMINAQFNIKGIAQTRFNEIYKVLSKNRAQGLTSM